MSLTNPKNVVTEQDLKDFYDSILPYLGGSADAGFTPVGTIIPMIAETAPANYLICDGTAYNKVDYPELAAHLLSMTNHSMYEVSGDSTKFKVPDLRGEFLRGTGTNGHANQGNGANVGTHQDATSVPLFWLTSSALQMRSLKNNNVEITDYDKSYADSGTIQTTTITAGRADQGSVNRITLRPTNTSVLYCIAVKNIFINPTIADASNIAPIEKNATSSRAYSRAGLKLIWNGVLYKTKTSIAIGDTFTVGTNIELSEDVETQIDASAKKNDLTNINIFGSTNNTGAKIDEGMFFYLNSALVRAKADIAANATLTLNTNYEAVTAGGLNKLQSDLATVKSSLTPLINAPTFTRTKVTNGNNFQIIGSHSNQFYLIYGTTSTNADDTVLTFIFKRDNTSNVGSVKHFGANAFSVGIDPNSYTITLYNMSQYLTITIMSGYEFALT